MGVGGLRGRAVRAAGLCVSTVLVAGALLAAAGCGASSAESEQALREGIAVDVAQLTSLTTSSATRLFDSEFTQQLEAADVDPATVYGPMFDELSYAIDDVQVDGDQAQVKLTVTNKNLTAALQTYTAMVTNELSTQAGRDALAALDDAALTRHLADVLVQCLRDVSVGTVTTAVDLSYAKDGGSWALQNPEALTAALLGDLDAAAAGEASDAQLQATAEAAAADLAQLLPSEEPLAEQPAEGEGAVESVG